MNKIRNRLVKKYVESCDNQSGSFLQHQLEAIRQKAWLAGWDKRDKISDDNYKAATEWQNLALRFQRENADQENKILELKEAISQAKFYVEIDQCKCILNYKCTRCQTLEKMK